MYVHKLQGIYSICHTSSSCNLLSCCWQLFSVYWIGFLASSMCHVTWYVYGRREVKVYLTEIMKYGEFCNTLQKFMIVALLACFMLVKFDWSLCSVWGLFLLHSRNTDNNWLVAVRLQTCLIDVELCEVLCVEWLALHFMFVLVVLFLPISSLVKCGPYPPLGLIWTVMLVWRKGNINRTVSVLSIV